MSALDTVPHALRPARGTAQGALVLLHGRGSSEHDLPVIGDALDPDRRLVVLTPRAGLERDERHADWYTFETVGHPEPATFAAGFERLSRWLDAVPEATGVPWSRTVVGGFSQGAVMAYAMGLADSRPRPAGVLALSGFLPEVDGVPLATTPLDGLGVAIGHGIWDEVIPIAFAREARRRLEELGAEVLYRELPSTHGIDPQFVFVLQNWLADATRAA
jgi:phospholipase/carboxylesterase